MRISIIVAASENNVIGRENDIPWHLPDDLKYFRKKTSGHPIIMGRKTFESLPNGALPKRTNIVVSRDGSYKAEGAQVASTLGEAIMYAQKDEKDEIFIIGGAEIYKHAMPLANYLYFTRVHAWIKGDKEFPAIGPEWEQVIREDHPVDDKHKMACTFFTYKKADRLHL
jgi:dihydrofolate reductase